MLFRSGKPWLLALMSGTIAPMQDQTTDSPPRRRWRLVAGLSLAVVLMSAGVWLASNRVGPERPEPLWTRADIPRAPAEADNGWVLVVTDKNVAELPDELSMLVNSEELTSDEQWAAVEAKGASLQRWLASAEVRDALATFELARARPRFVDACEFGGHCTVFSWLELHRVAELEALELARTGQPDAAATQLRALIRMDTSHMESARTLVSALIALANLERALDKADKLAAYTRVDGRPPSPAMLELAAVVERVAVERVDLGMTVISDYLFMVEALESVAAGEPSEPFALEARPHWLYDHGRTMAELNQRFEQRYAAAQIGDVANMLGADEPVLTESFGWWLHDATGKLLLDATRMQASSVSESVAERQAEIARLRASVLAQLTSSAAPGAR